MLATIYGNNEEQWQTNIIKDLAKEYNLREWVVRDIVYYPLLVVKRTMVDLYEERPVRVRKLGIFHMKPKSSKPLKNDERREFLLEHADKLYNVLRPGKSKKEFETKKDYIRYVSSKRNSKVLKGMMKWVEENVEM